MGSTRSREESSILVKDTVPPEPRQWEEGGRGSSRGLPKMTEHEQKIKYLINHQFASKLLDFLIK